MELDNIKGIGEAAKKLLNQIGVHTIEDLVYNIPRAYDDYSKIQSIRQIKPGAVTIKARLHAVKARYSKNGLHITEALASDDSGSVKVTWFNQPYRARAIKADAEYFISGQFAQNYKFFSINSPSCELVSDFPLHTARLVPRYKLTKGLSAHQLRKYTMSALDRIDVPENLPQWLRESHQLIDIREALLTMHFPKTHIALKHAKRRIGFEELFELTLASELNRREFNKQSGVSVPFAEKLVREFVTSLPYRLTDDQRKAAWEILQDMQEGSPMNRLVEGDVGSGKTVVAAIAMLNAAASGFQSALMAPTEILASQHVRTLKAFLPKALSRSIVFLSGSLTKNERQASYKRIASGEAKIIVGTHALFQAATTFSNLGLIIIDEQHRFGVDQRKELQSKARTMPHVLHMTATPIPRSLMLTLYGELDASIIAQKPPGRTDVATHIIMPEQRPKLYEKMKEVLNKGQQVYVVCPQIEDTSETKKAQRPLDATGIHSQITKWLTGYSIALLHGKMKSGEKDEIMGRFKRGDVHVLVSTTVIEVGVDVPNATVMIIEGADQFGLAQIHQLRGRVGRGEIAGRCYLVPVDNGQVNERLKVLSKETNGFNLAEYDLQLRGPGAIYGTLQHGALDLRVANITDVKLIAEARRASQEFIARGENLLHYPRLKARVSHLRKITNFN